MKKKKLVNQLLEVAAELSTQRMCILGEGNVSGLMNDGIFLVKASGTSLSTLKAEHLVSVEQQPFLEVIQSNVEYSDSEMEQLLMDSRTDPDSLKPSVETQFHAWLLSLPTIEAVGHCHPIAVNQILCSPRKKDFAAKRLFPDQVVYCGARSVLVEYVDPGLVLARKIAEKVTQYLDTYNKPPRTILLENHGLITLGSNYKEVISAALMAEKSAEIFTGADSLGGPIFMDEQEVDRIDNRMDEAYRRKIAKSEN